MKAINTRYLKLAHVTLYQRPSCPFCIRVEHATRAMGLQIKSVNTSSEPKARKELIEDGGKSQVPALKIEQPDGEAVWLYESLDIIHFLKEHFAHSAVAANL
ncbi:glutaredoxin family protein [Teredinibacter waterburyi]|jgi:Glutaredoxin and related proteins|uniref:glutaredoxin family protein n=1 Tax=Teredinibacter waterburyi TaxID=1500538 RepID=UPI00165FC40E|nr:glutaredoxin [Teredinibacter waterburyi]